MLTAIKLVHTVIWALLAASIVALPVAGVLRRFGWAAILTVVILIECGVLALNGGRCPLTDVAARFTDERADNFDIYLGIGSVYPAGCYQSENVSPQLCSSLPKRGEDKRMELVAVLILIALIAVVGGIVEESAETH